MGFNVAVLGISFLPGLVWLLFFSEEDSHPEPKRLVAAVFIIGMMSAIVTLLVGGALKALIFGLDNTAYSLPYLASAALLEELFKFTFVALFIRHLGAFNEPVDAMMYMGIGALGFATLENLAYLSREVENIPQLSRVANPKAPITIYIMASTGS